MENNLPFCIASCEIYFRLFFAVGQDREVKSTINYCNTKIICNYGWMLHSPTAKIISANVYCNTNTFRTAKIDHDRKYSCPSSILHHTLPSITPSPPSYPHLTIPVLSSHPSLLTHHTLTDHILTSPSHFSPHLTLPLLSSPPTHHTLTSH